MIYNFLIFSIQYYYIIMKTQSQTKPVSYEAILDNNDKFIDHVPPFLKNGIQCSCEEDNIIYDNENKFLSHINTKRHKKWLLRLNQIKEILY